MPEHRNNNAPCVGRIEIRKVDVMIETSVLIVGGGPVEVDACDRPGIARVDVTVVESRTAAEPPAIKCNLVSARSMEVYRRLGCAPANFGIAACRRIIRSMSLRARH